MPETNTEDIEIRSEQVQDILTKVPHWIISSGSTILLFLIMIILFISWFIKYPDTISSQVILTTQNPPQRLFANAPGSFESILVSNQDSVAVGQPLAIIKNSALYEDVLLLKTVIDSIEVDRNNFHFPIYELPPLVLGELNTSFAAFENSYKEYLAIQRFNPYQNKVQTDKESLTDARIQLGILIENKGINEKRMKNVRDNAARNKELFDEALISPEEYELKRIEYLQNERDHVNLDKSISQARLRIRNLEQSIKNAFVEDDLNSIKTLRQTLQVYYQLQKELEDWERRYLLKASIKGQVSLLKVWNKNQTVNTGDLIFTIIPADNEAYIGKMIAPPQNSGKIVNGQMVQIKLANYPPDQYGKLNGIVSSISLVPDSDGNYVIDIAIPKELKTTYGRSITFNHNMQGTADIITEDLRIMERFFYQLKNIF